MAKATSAIGPGEQVPESRSNHKQRLPQGPSLLGKCETMDPNRRDSNRDSQDQSLETLGSRLRRGSCYLPLLLEAVSMAKCKIKRKRAPKSVLKLPDLEQVKSAVLNSLTSPSSQRTYDLAIREFHRMVQFRTEARLQ